MMPFKISLRKRQVHCVFSLLLPLFTTLACSNDKSEITSRLSHDFNGSHELFSFGVKASETLAGSEATSKKMYGRFASHLKSPETVFTCLWRNPDVAAKDSSRPEEIFVTCNYAKRPHENPRSPVAAAGKYNTIDRANLKAMWERTNGGYLLTRLEVEIMAGDKSFRSQNLRVDMQEIDVVEWEAVFPETKNDEFQFTLNSKLPARRNSGAEKTDPIVSVSFSGKAEPMPSWHNY